MGADSFSPDFAGEALIEETGACPRIGLALGGGGARGLAHVHALHAFDDLGIKPHRIAGTSIGALIGAAYAAGMPAAVVEEFVVEMLGNKRLVASRLWRTRPSTFAEFRADGGFRLGQLNAERVVGAFLPLELPLRFEDLAIPMSITATDFYAGEVRSLETGDLLSAIAASAALPAIFRPVRRDGQVLIDGGICDPLPFDLLAGRVDLSIAVDVTGGPLQTSDKLPSPIDTMFGSSQLMMHAIIQAKLAHSPPDLVVAPPVSPYRVLDFLRVRTILAETAHLREELKRKIAALCELRGFDIEVSRA
ncbi:patatin-like phospholipase family protein [Aureimonas fodinaquatilis]|uniref:Patatin-like phospholipase family protein n=1 Tax=Aureimonas fodinaquatilis TaxID=2565783 RepID=A0A5B0E491_9HYPH|nr:patatin-like phospholipase family protein [Aureimonas fodinaquatilis]KAA0972209.1 patatin-like phospholipase family protein [Aureimonas fodinaquatilis]